jgi:ribosome modulation factor
MDRQVDALQRIRAAYHAGMEAAGLGKSVAASPAYNTNDCLTAWRTGWQDAMHLGIGTNGTMSGAQTPPPFVE